MSGVKSFFQMLGFTGGEEDAMNNEERYENDPEEEEDDEEEEDEEEERGGFGLKFKLPIFGRKNRQEDSEEEEADEEEDEQEEATSHASSQKKQQFRNSRVIDYNKKTREKKNADDSADAAEKHCEHIVIVRQLGDSRSIITHLHNGDSVILNLENIDPKDCGRVIDLLSGAAFALGGNIIKVSRLTYLLAPGSVKVVPPQSAPTANRYTL